MSAPDLCRKHGISDATFYTGSRKHGDMEVADAKRGKALEGFVRTNRLKAGRAVS